MLYVNFIASLNGLLLLFIIYRFSRKEKGNFTMKYSKIILCGIVYVCFKKLSLYALKAHTRREFR